MTNTARFSTAAGWLTRYALSCGYVERFEVEGRTVTLWYEGGVFHVRACDRCTRLAWETVERLSAARRLFSKWRAAVAAKERKR